MTDGLTMNQLSERNAELVSEVEKLNQKLMAYEQAAKNPVAYRNKFTGRFFTLEQQPDAATDTAVYEPVFLEAPVLPVIPEGFTCDDGILTANLGAGDVLISNVNWPDSGHAGVAFAPVPQPKRENLADYTDVVSGRTTQDIGSVFVVKSSSVESLLVLREKVDAAIANFGAQPVIPAQPAGFDRKEIIRKVHNLCSRISGSTFANAAEFAIDEVMATQAAIPKWPSDEVERDALRYRFLRDSDFFGDEDEPGLVGWKELFELSYNKFDAAVDARMAHPDIDYVKLDTELCKHIPAQPAGKHKTEGDFLSRLKSEFADLQDRAEKLAAFIQGNSAFKKLAPRMQRLLESQIVAMTEYAQILECRIELIEAAPAQEGE